METNEIMKGIEMPRGIPKVHGDRRTFGPIQLLVSGAIVVLLLHSNFFGEPSDPGSKEIRAKKFTLVDANGEERGELAIMRNGQPGFGIWNKKTATSASIYMDDSGMPHIELEGEDDKVGLELMVLEKQMPMLVLRDSLGRRRIVVAVGKSGRPQVNLYDENKVVRCSVSLAEEDQPTIAFRDKNDKLRGSLMVDASGNAALDLYDKDMRERIVIQVDGEDRANLVVFDKDGKPTWSPTAR